MVETYVIALDTDSDRFSRFTRMNHHLRFNVFRGINGNEISLAEAIQRGFITSDCANSGLVTKGRLGCAISHWTLWGTTIYHKKPILILEDDVVTHKDIQHWINRFDFPKRTDIVLFGINTDSVLSAISPEGVRQVSIYEDENPDYDLISRTLAITKTSDVRLWRLLNGFGLCSYLITPEGASKLVESALPLRLDAIEIPLVPDNVAGIGADRRLNALYPTLRAYVSVPFLAWTPNSESTTSG